MSHFTVLVLTNGKKSVDQLLAPYDENGTCFREADGERPASRWDWWVIGGRWTGMFSDYDGEQDPRNYSVCDLCGGTGTRPDMVHGMPTGRKEAKTDRAYHVVRMTAERAADLKKHNETPHPFMAVHRERGWKPYTTGCNGCGGSGASRNFRNRQRADLDILPVKKILAKYVTAEYVTTAIVTPDGEWHERGETGWWGMPRGPQKEPDAWFKEWLALLKKHSDLTAVLVDCHV